MNEVLIEDCLFENCEYNYDANRNDRGGVISGNNSNNIVIRSSKFIKCGIRNRSSYDPRCAISNLYNIIVENCYFEKCMAYYDETVKHTDAKLFVYNCSIINNKIVDSLDF